ncbi:hypothetical protein GCM10010156_44740 [Planobispora rosea]|uniref:Uncharacterized protein n=1 Tax=Planobispora rosea TaxID=35762 RepID=A0A8J3S336_PLARO|nr:hypothetical protein [Planobispora rosea]GGS81002.1 hypothetical protein GCM10010156_44740 [Planobispora rosea]GIH85935.1 hypothetical protein Pro02_43430 [Planobispora rosea]
MTAVHPRRPARRYGPEEDPAIAETEAVIQALSLRRPVTEVAENDEAVRLLLALIDDVDQRCSSVSITPSA